MAKVGALNANAGKAGEDSMNRMLQLRQKPCPSNLPDDRQPR